MAISHSVGTQHPVDIVCMLNVHVSLRSIVNILNSDAHAQHAYACAQHAQLQYSLTCTTSRTVSSRTPKVPFSLMLQQHGAPRTSV